MNFLSNRKRDKTVTKTFRVSESASMALEEDAKKDNVSLNTFVNRLLVRYANFERVVANRTEMALTPTDLLREIFDRVSDEEMASVGKEYGKTVVWQNLVLETKGHRSVPAAIDFMKDVANYSSWEVADVIHDAGRRRTVTIIHRLGPKWGLCLGNAFKSFFESFGPAPKVYSDGNTIVLEFALTTATLSSTDNRRT